MQRTVGATLDLDIEQPAELVFAIAVAAEYGDVEETLAIELNGSGLAADEIADAHGTRLHRLTAPAGTLRVRYRATVGSPAPVPELDEADLVRYGRPSRYCESDVLEPTARAEFDGLGPAELLTAVSSWVGTRLTYAPGSSLPTDGAVRTLLGRRGVCRDYAHLSIALLRACGVPARLAAVYAPGLDPMDFHAVCEAYVEDGWRVVDPTTLAPRQSLLRIATGRDAADTAFLSVLSGKAELTQLSVTATVDELPTDDLDSPVRLR